LRQPARQVKLVVLEVCDAHRTTLVVTPGRESLTGAVTKVRATANQDLPPAAMLGDGARRETSSPAPSGHRRDGHAALARAGSPGGRPFDIHSFGGLCRRRAMFMVRDKEAADATSDRGNDRRARRTITVTRAHRWMVGS
jgi:hypothetical protein